MPHNYFYLTTTLPYVNAAPHIGFAQEIVAADVIARYQRLLDKKVIFNTGTDEHGQKIYQKAIAVGKTPQEYVDEYAAKFNNLKQLLNLSYDHFIRTTDQDHIEAAQEFWRRCAANGYIYKNQYKTKYCVGCELEKTDSELENGRCPLHPKNEIELREEENYFFKFSAFTDQLLELYQTNAEFVKPAGKQKEITSFVKQGLRDFSISRLKEKMPWGIPVPGDKDHVMYVWFDALVNYISTLGWPDESESSAYKLFWPGIQLAGKDNLRQQAAMWQAMLMAAGLPNSKQILINGFISINGQKISKSLGNVISPTEMFERYGIDGTRYLLMKLGPFGTDMDVSWDKLDNAYTADLANGLGNLCSRVAKMCEKVGTIIISPDDAPHFEQNFTKLMEQYELGQGLNFIIHLIAKTDHYLSEQQPWRKKGSTQKAILREAVWKIQQIGLHLQPFMPATAQKILAHFSQEKIAAISPLFPRLPKE